MSFNMWRWRTRVESEITNENYNNRNIVIVSLEEMWLIFYRAFRKRDFTSSVITGKELSSIPADKQNI